MFILSIILLKQEPSPAGEALCFTGARVPRAARFVPAAYYVAFSSQPLVFLMPYFFLSIWLLSFFVLPGFPGLKGVFVPIPYITPGFMPDGFIAPNVTGNEALGSLDPTRPLSDALDSVFGSNRPEENRTIENSAYADFPGSVNAIDYLDAPYAEHYGMSAETAYQEALAGSAYQRKVADLKKAGLNPVLGIQGNGASSFGGSLASNGSYNSGYSVDDGFELSPQIAGALATVAALILTKGQVYKSATLGNVVQNIVYGINDKKR